MTQNDILFDENKDVNPITMSRNIAFIKTLSLSTPPQHDLILNQIKMKQNHIQL